MCQTRPRNPAEAPPRSRQPERQVHILHIGEKILAERANRIQRANAKQQAASCKERARLPRRCAEPALDLGYGGAFMIVAPQSSRDRKRSAGEPDAFWRVEPDDQGCQRRDALVGLRSGQ